MRYRKANEPGVTRWVSEDGRVVLHRRPRGANTRWHVRVDGVGTGECFGRLSDAKAHAAEVRASAWHQLVRVAGELKLPESFQDDLFVHDRAAIESHQADDFAWFLYESGTWIARAASWRARVGSRATPPEVERSFGAGHWFWWDASLRQLRPLSDANEAHRLLKGEAHD